MRVTRATYRLAGDGSPGVCASTESNKTLDSRSSVPSGGELCSKEKFRFRPSGGVIGREATVVEHWGRWFSTFCGLFGTKPAPRHPARILSGLIAFARARMNICSHSGREIRWVLSRE